MIPTKTAVSTYHRRRASFANTAASQRALPKRYRLNPGSKKAYNIKLAPNLSKKTQMPLQSFAATY